ncbi:glycosyltransferase family 4 protein [Geobacter sp. FeAm09]|uniref:glycosyltransferase family 4 protein n=1 Tax=Geobacter sp. FeAm09 TaxID=2597769 RepID=UPI00143D391B|nr:glycosyltransferase family 4 protein [Geobacter sp. FeAm09]
MEKNVLIVARWPLGGIRTYMRYLFRYLPAHYRLTLLASQTHEDAALANDVEEYRARLIIVREADTKGLVSAAFRELRTNRYDVILSQGFISAVAVSLANLFFRVPQIVTIHGILEPKYLTGRLGWLKHFLLRKMIGRITVLYAVSNDILSHLHEQFPELAHNGQRSIVIPNGIELGALEHLPASPIDLRAEFGIDDATFLLGFFGRFMPQKGFDLLVEAVRMLKKQQYGRKFAVVAVGSGDYLKEYRAKIRELDLEPCFHFLPFQSEVCHLYAQINAIVMPSRWEASGLLAMEALCTGTPLVAADCIGLRETVHDTPAMVFASENVGALADALRKSIDEPRTDEFQRFVPLARSRYDVRASAQQLAQLLDSIR